MLSFQRRELAVALVAAVLTGAAVYVIDQYGGRFRLPLLAALATFGLVLAVALVFRKIAFRIDEARRLTEAGVALYQLLQPVAPLPILRDFRIAPDSAVLLHALLLKRRPGLVVEAGSGASSLIIGYTLKRLGAGRVISLELDEAHARKTREHVELHGLTDQVTVVHAPLREVVVDGATYRWHDTGALDALGTIDFVFDDSPPMHLGKELRYAGLPALTPRLAGDAVYCVNFVADEEQRNVARWIARDPSWRVDWHTTKKGNAVLRRG